MINLAAEIDNLKKDLDRSKTELLNMYMELGEISVSWHQAICFEPSYEAFNKLCDVAKQKEEIDNQIETLKTALEHMSFSDKHIEETKVTMKELDLRYNILISSLGAIAIEIESQGKLPQRLVKCLEPMHEYEKKLKELEEKQKKFEEKGNKILSSILARKIKHMNLRLDDIFSQTGRKIYNSGDFREVPGQRARIILDEMEQIRFLKKNYKNDILDHKNTIDEAQGSLKNIGAYGEENRKLRELQLKQGQILDKLSERFTEYGSILAEGMQYWMDEQAPEKLKKCCAQIIKQQRRMEQMHLNLEHVMMERDIEIHTMQSSQLSEQMNHLNNQIQAIENQKSELQIKLDAELKAISDLRMKQNELSQKASMI